MLRNQRDWQSLSYLILQPLLVAWLWRTGLNTLINLALFALMLFLTLGISVIHHKLPSRTCGTHAAVQSR